MKLKNISVVTDILSPVLFGNKVLFCVGAKHARKYLLEPFCYGKPSKLPLPQKIFDFSPTEYLDGIDGISVQPLSDLKEAHAEDAVILIAAEDLEFYRYLGELYDNLHCYYFPILPCTAIEAFFYALEHETEIDEISESFSDIISRKKYKEYWESRIAGCVYNPSLYSEQPYWGNDIVPYLPYNGTIVLGGAYNGLHIDRAQKYNFMSKALLFEPNPTWSTYLEKKYSNVSKIRVIPKALYNSNREIAFDVSNELGAKICTNGNSNCCTVKTIRLDDFNLNDVAIIALDIEGTELQAIEGAINTIKLCRPILSICAYHKISDYVDIPQYIQRLGLNYDLYFRQHSCYYEESVVYAIPKK